MSEIPFDKTVAGRQLLDRQIPEFLKELRLLRSAAERIAVALEKGETRSAAEDDQ